MKFIQVVVLICLGLAACKNEEVIRDSPLLKDAVGYQELSEEEALSGLKYIEIKGNKYIFDAIEAQNNGVSDKVITVLSENIDQINSFLTEEIKYLSDNPDSIRFYSLRLLDFKKLNKNNINNTPDSLYQEKRLK